MMMELIGIIKGRHTDPDTERCARAQKAFEAYRDLKVGEELDQNSMSVIKRLRENVIRNAQVIVITTASAGLPRLIEIIESTVEVIIADESPRERELSYMPLFAAKFTKIQDSIMLGDWLQIRPLVIRSESKFIFAKQAEITFMPRLVANGIRMFELTEQHRMNEHLCEMINYLTYGGKLTTHGSALVENRPASQLFHRGVASFTGVESPALLVNVPICHANVTSKEQKSNSRYDKFFVTISIKVAERLLDLDPLITVAMLCGYTAQARRLRDARDDFKEKRPELFKVNPDRLVAETVDSVQGEEFDFTISSILSIGPDIGHQADPCRSNVLDSRAKNGYMMIATVADLKSRKERDDYVGRLIDYLKPFSYDWES